MNEHLMNIYDPWPERLSEYLDGDLDAADRAALEAHLQGCDDCRATLTELREVVSLAHHLEDRAPAHDLWTGIRDRIGTAAAAGLAAAPRGGAIPFRRRPPRRFAFTIPQLAAAGIALILMTGGAVWLLGTAPGAATVAAHEAGPPAPGSVDNGGVGTATHLAATGGAPAAPRFASHLAGAPYDVAVADLQQALTAGREVLAPATIAVLEENMAIIDRAIAEATSALAEDPANIYLTNYLADTMKRKLELLRYTNAIILAQS